MLTEPKLEHREELHFVAIQAKVKRKDIPVTLPQLIPEIIKWLIDNNILAYGRPFFEYLEMDNDQLLVNVGVLLQNEIKGNQRIIGGKFKAGTYATITYMGNYSHLFEAHMALESWIEKNDLQEKKEIHENGVKWGSRTEFYITDPQKEPNPDNWLTDVVFLLTDTTQILLN